MKQKESGNTFSARVRRVFKDYVLRTFISSTLSLLVTVVFAGYNAFLGIFYGTAWNVGIAVYYALLVGLRAYILFSEKRLHKQNLSDERKEEARKRLFFVWSIVLFLIDLALIAPITMMLMQKKEIRYSLIPAIATAAYTFYKIILATVNYIKSKRMRHLSVQILRNIKFVDALVSVLSLQYALVMEFGGGIQGDMLTLCATTSFAVWALLIAISVLSIVKVVKLKKS